MRRAIVRLVWAAALGGLLAGCERAALQPPDVLLANKRPADKKAEPPEAVLVAQHEPAPPPLPETALASAPREVRAAIAVAQKQERRATPAETVAAPKAPVPAMPAVRRQVKGTYGHADDHRWLQGVLEGYSQGYWCLRYGDPAEEGARGGKVCLEDDPRLAQFREGDVVFVEGSLVRDKGPETQYPHYRITAIRLVHRGDGP